MSAHLPLHRLDPGATLDSEERAHLEQCPRCRVEARMLIAALEEDPAGTPGLEEARATLDQVRSRTLETLTTGVNSLSYAFGVIAGPPEHPAEMPGVDTERFQAVRWVETGPLGPLYEVEDLETGRRLALRVLQEVDEETVARIGHYIDRLATRKIAGVAPPVELREVGAHWTVATPWVAGQPLHAMLHGATDPLRPEPADEGDLPRVLVAVQQVAAALAQLHDLGLVHGHLAPSNIFVTLLGRAVLLDPGLWSPRPDTRASSPWVSYAAPERAAGAEPTAAGDWYGLGALLHHALTGQLPRPGEVAPGDPDAEGVAQLAALTAALTAATPEARPSASQVLATLVEVTSHTVLAATRYLDVGLLGVGGMGEVRQVLDPALNRTIALKVLHPRLGHTRSHEDRFISEAQVTAQLEHPGIVPVYASGRMPDGRPYFTMKEVRGRTLAEVITEVHAAAAPHEWRPAESGWTFRRLVEAFHRICEAVAYAHARGVLHRDLKPSNVMVGDFGEVLVMDWGLARVRAGSPWGTMEMVQTDRSLDPSQATRVGTVSGTPGYMSPEQARGET
ncbi:MAG: protein kinase, partial [Deltaproteobacteria bacterium]|nr:protein kinase [Deltaproteobacteria bacterium]